MKRTHTDIYTFVFCIEIVCYTHMQICVHTDIFVHKVKATYSLRFILVKAIVIGKPKLVFSTSILLNILGISVERMFI